MKIVGRQQAGNVSCNAISNKMKFLFLITIALTISGCDQIVSPTRPKGKLKQYKGDNMINEVYDIADLKNFYDNTKFITRLTYFIPFRPKTFIEMDEISNGINLCVKQPAVQLMDGEYFDSSRSLPFNQICYWYADSTAKSIKKLFYQYNSGKEIEDRKCKECLHPIFWKIEIYDHGKYSSIAKDYFSDSDKQFIDSILNKAHLKESDEYRLPIFK